MVADIIPKYECDCRDSNMRISEQDGKIRNDKYEYLGTALKRYSFLPISSEMETDYNEECGNR